MSYEPKEWVRGETITANGLNNLEEGIQEALDYCESGGGSSLLNVLILTEELIQPGNYYVLKKQDGTYLTDDDVSVDSMPMLELILIDKVEVGNSFECHWYHISSVDDDSLRFGQEENLRTYFIDEQGEWFRSSVVA